MEIIEFIIGKGLPNTVSAVFSVSIILGIVFIFVTFAFKAWKAYHEYTLLKLQDLRKDISNQQTDKSVEIALKVYDKLTEFTNSIAGKYATKEELQRFHNEITKDISDLRDETSKIKGKFGID